MTPTAGFRAARDFLIEHRADYQTAYTGFRWPDLPVFNWAIDWFDAELAPVMIKAGPRRCDPALIITGAGAAAQDDLRENPSCGAAPCRGEPHRAPSLRVSRR